MPDEAQPGDGSGDEPSDPSRRDPFGGMLPFDLSGIDLGQMMRMLQSPGPVNWEIAGQVAAAVARGGETRPEPPIAASDADELAGLVRAAEGLVAEETGRATALTVPMRAVTREEWARLHLDALRPVLEALATALRRSLDEPEGDAPAPEPLQHPSLGGLFGGGDPFGGMLTMLAPVLLGVQAGSMIGYLAQHALGRYDLPLPVSDAPSVVFVVPNLDTFEASWSLERRDLRFAVALHEMTRATVRSVPWVQPRLVRLATEYVSAYAPDPGALEARFGDLDPSDPESIHRLGEHPEALLGAMQTDEQRAVLERIAQFTIVLEGYCDLVLERIGERMLPSLPQVQEAMRRHHVEQGEAERFVEGLLGLRLDRDHYERGDAFCRGVVERAGMAGLNRLWDDERMVPTPAELEAPGLWLARIELPDLD